jgi:tRNA dimethylallyltransferase
MDYSAMSGYNCILVIGATASGKTQLAAHIAHALNAEIISIDSRQVYKELTIGSGKDLNEYIVNKTPVPYHLIDVVSVNDEYHIHQYLQDYTQAFTNITAKGKPVVLCGGSAMYIYSMLTQAQYTGVPVNTALRADLEQKSLTELQVIYTLHEPLPHAEITHHKRIIRAIEIQQYLANNTYQPIALPKLNPLIIGLESNTEQRRAKIKKRLTYRLQHGLITEVEQLLQHTTTPERLIHMGLEYKYITQYVQKQLTYAELETQLYNAICQYAKAQTTWLRKLVREGNNIHWLSTNNTLAYNTKYSCDLWNNKLKM